MSLLPLSSYPNPDLRGWRVGEGALQPERWYRAARWLVRMLISSYCQVRVFNRHYEPSSGGAIYVCNHQSFLDPMLAGLALRRSLNFMARASLFKGVLGPMIRSVNSFPVRRGTADLGAIKEAMRRIKRGSQVTIFPEGTRTRDGRIGAFLPGMAILSQRVADWTVPVLIEGAFEVWPRKQMLPLPGNIVVQYGRAISRAEARSYTPQAFVDNVRQRLITIQTDVRRRAGKRLFEYE